VNEEHIENYLESENRPREIRPMLYAALGACAAVLSFHYLPRPLVFALICVSLILSGVLFFRRLKLFLFPLALCLVFIRMYLVPIDKSVNGTFEITGVVAVYPAENDDQSILILKDVKLNGVSQNGRLKLYCPLDDYCIGDSITTCADVYEPPDFADAANDAVTHCANTEFTPEVEVNPHYFDLMTIPNFLRSYFSKAVKAMYDDYSGLVLGLILGEKSSVGYTTMQMFKRSGLIHIFAVSGLHYSYIIGVFLCLNKSIHIKTFFITLGASLLFAAFTGFSPSVMRAAVMLCVISFTRSTWRVSDPMSSLLLAFFVVLLIKPFSLYSLGFQLSFASMFGIVCHAESISRITPLPFTFVNENISTAIASTTASAPILCRYFGGISLIGLPISIVVLPVIGPLLILIMLSVMGYAIYPMIGKLLSYAVKVVLDAIIWLVKPVSFPLFAMPSPSILVIFLYLLSVFLISPIHTNGKRTPLLAGFCMLVLSAALWILV